MGLFASGLQRVQSSTAGRQQGVGGPWSRNRSQNQGQVFPKSLPLLVWLLPPGTHLSEFLEHSKVAVAAEEQVPSARDILDSGFCECRGLQPTDCSLP